MTCVAIHGFDRWHALQEIGWYCGNNNIANFAYGSKEVAQLIPNDFGLYDTLGNVWSGPMIRTLPSLQVPLWILMRQLDKSLFDVVELTVALHLHSTKRFSNLASSDLMACPFDWYVYRSLNPLRFHWYIHQTPRTSG